MHDHTLLDRRRRARFMPLATPALKRSRIPSICIAELPEWPAGSRRKQARAVRPPTGLTMATIQCREMSNEDSCDRRETPAARPGGRAAALRAKRGKGDLCEEDLSMPALSTAGLPWPHRSDQHR